MTYCRSDVGYKSFLFPLVIALLCGTLAGCSTMFPGVARRRAQTVEAQARQRGFKTRLADFRVELPPGEAARAALITNTSMMLRGNFREPWSWGMRPAGTGAARCLWQSSTDIAPVRDSLPYAPELFRTVRNLLLEERPLKFAAEPAGYDWFYHQFLRPLSKAFQARMELSLHAGDWDDAYTNLLAVIALGVRYEPAPVEVQHIIRADLVGNALASTWEALQTNVWSDSQLAALENLWRKADFFCAWEEIPMFECALLLNDLEEDMRFHANEPGFGYTSPLHCVTGGRPKITLRWRWEQFKWQRVGHQTGKIMALRFFEAMAKDYRAAMMRKSLADPFSDTVDLPGFEGEVAGFVGRNRICQQFLEYGSERHDGCLKTYEAEAMRRIVLSAIAVERARLRLGRLPATLGEAGPVPDDYITGKPLPYLPEDDGTYLIYSIGIDQRDNGGHIRDPKEFGESYDLVWPRRVRPADAPDPTAAQ